MRSEIETLEAEFELVWRLAQHTLPELDDAACLWAPAPGAWTVRRDAAGVWRADFSEAEPDPAPPTTIAWTLWHLSWWWSGLMAALDGRTPAAPAETPWPGGAHAAVAQAEALAAAWRAALAERADADLATLIAHPWPAPRPLRRAIGWAHLELMKNVAEIGALWRQYEAVRRANEASAPRG